MGGAGGVWRAGGRGDEPSRAAVLVPDRRLVCRCATGRVSVVWWSGVGAMDVELPREQIVIDYGDGQPVSLSGSWVAPVAVAGVAAIYGTQALVGHPALAQLRREGPTAGILKPVL